MRKSLASVQYDENELKRQMKAQMDEAIKVRPHETVRSHAPARRLRARLKEYTYLDCNGQPVAAPTVAELPGTPNPKRDKIQSPASDENGPQSTDPMFAVR